MVTVISTWSRARGCQRDATYLLGVGALVDVLDALAAAGVVALRVAVHLWIAVDVVAGHGWVGRGGLEGGLADDFRSWVRGEELTSSLAGENCGAAAERATRVMMVVVMEKANFIVAV